MSIKELSLLNNVHVSTMNYRKQFRYLKASDTVKGSLTKEREQALDQNLAPRSDLDKKETFNLKSWLQM